MSTKDLLAELDAEFGKKPKKAKVDATKQTVTDRNSTGTLSDVIAEANATSRSWAEVPGFEAVRRVTRVHHQACRCCGVVVSYIANVFTEFESKRLRAKVQAPEAVFHDSLGFEIPHEVEEFSHHTEQCAACIRLSRKVDDLLEVVDFDLQRKAKQLSLFRVNGVLLAKEETKH